MFSAVCTTTCAHTGVYFKAENGRWTAEEQDDGTSRLEPRRTIHYMHSGESSPPPMSHAPSTTRTLVSHHPPPMSHAPSTTCTLLSHHTPPMLVSHGHYNVGISRYQSWNEPCVTLYRLHVLHESTCMCDMKAHACDVRPHA